MVTSSAIGKTLELEQKLASLHRNRLTAARLGRPHNNDDNYDDDDYLKIIVDIKHKIIIMCAKR